MTPLAGNLNLSSLIDERVRGPGTIYEFNSGGCQQLSPKAQARARSGCGALFRVLGNGNWCIENQKSFSDPVCGVRSVAIRFIRCSAEPGSAILFIMIANLRNLNDITFNSVNQPMFVRNSTRPKST